MPFLKPEGDPARDESAQSGNKMRGICILFISLMLVACESTGTAGFDCPEHDECTDVPGQDWTGIEMYMPEVPGQAPVQGTYVRLDVEDSHIVTPLVHGEGYMDLWISPLDPEVTVELSTDSFSVYRVEISEEAQADQVFIRDLDGNVPYVSNGIQFHMTIENPHDYSMQLPIFTQLESVE